MKTNLLRLLADEFAFSGEMKDRNRVLKFIRLNPGTKRAPILRYCHVSARQLDGLLATLIAAESVRKVDGQLFPLSDPPFANVRKPKANAK